jgi:hypothetical protein
LTRAKKAKLAEWFGVEVSTINQWIKDGMPDGEVAEIEDWLVKVGIAQPPEETISTDREIAKLLDISSVTASTYRYKADFPTGPPWSVREVLEWFDARQKREEDEPPTLQDRLSQLKIEAAIRKEQREAGELIAIEDVQDEMMRQNVLAKQKMKRLIPMLITLLPPDTDERVIADYRARATKILDDAFQDLAQAFRGDGE